MFKKLCLVLILSLALLVGSGLACQPDDTCTLMKGTKIVQVMPDGSLRGVVVPDDVEISIGPELTPEMVANLNSQTNMDWTDGNIGVVMVDFGTGPTPVMVVVKETDVKDCR